MTHPALATMVEAAKKATPGEWVAKSQPNFGNGYIYTSVQPVTPDPETMRHLEMASGEYHVCRMTHTPVHSRSLLYRKDAEFIAQCSPANILSIAQYVKGLEEATADLLSAIGDWARPTGANGMTSAGENHPLMVAAKKASAALSGGKP